MTDESPASCRAFLNGAGVELFMNTLKVGADLQDLSITPVYDKFARTERNIFLNKLGALSSNLQSVFLCMPQNTKYRFFSLKFLSKI